MRASDSVTQRAVQTLGGEIREGRYPDGHPMPSESQLGARFGLSRSTVRIILARLERDGLVYRQQGKGTFARRPGPAPPPVAIWLTDLGQAGSPYLSELIAGAEAPLAQLGTHVSLTSAPLAAWSASFCERLAGVVVIPYRVTAADLERLTAYGLPYVVVQEADLPGPVVRMDPRGAARALAAGLLALGHRRFGLLSGHREHVDRQKRLGLAEALAADGLSLDEVPDYETGYASARAGDAARALLARRPAPTAVICFDDALALHGLAAAQEAGLRVPADVSFAGFNDSPFSALVTPALSTVRFPVRAAGAAAARLVLEAWRTHRPIESVDLGHELVWRGSTGPAAQETTDD